MIKELERVILTTDVPEQNLNSGHVGVVVLIHGQAEGFEVEFFTLDGKTLHVITVRAAQVRPVGEKDIMHARPVRPVQ